MSEALITCPLCGHSYPAAEHLACNSCPLQRGCQLVCCPQCGYKTVDPRQSVLAGALARWLSGAKDKASNPEA